MLTVSEVLADVRLFSRVSDEVMIDIHSRGSRDKTPLHSRAEVGDAAAIELLTAAGSDTNAADNSGNTSLHAAVLNLRVFGVRRLVALGADSGVTNKSGATPLDLAASVQFIIDELNAKPPIE